MRENEMLGKIFAKSRLQYIIYMRDEKFTKLSM